jgi:hypothetical protein
MKQTDDKQALKFIKPTLVFAGHYFDFEQGNQEAFEFQR